MPVFRFRLKDPRSSEFRHVSVAAASREEAIAVAMAREEKYSSYSLTDEKVFELSGGKASSIADWERALREGTLGPGDRARLLAHYQQKPYKLIGEAKED